MSFLNGIMDFWHQCSIFTIISKSYRYVRYFRIALVYGIFGIFFNKGLYSLLFLNILVEGLKHIYNFSILVFLFINSHARYFDGLYVIFDGDFEGL